MIAKDGTCTNIWITILNSVCLHEQSELEYVCPNNKSVKELPNITFNKIYSKSSRLNKRYSVEQDWILFRNANKIL